MERIVRWGWGIALAAAAACADDNGSAQSDVETTSGGDTTVGEEPDPDSSDTSTTGEEPDPGSTGSAQTGSSGGADTTGAGPEICDIDDADAPGFTLIHDAAPVPAMDAEVAVECGFQGAFMFFFGVQIEGVDPGGSDYVPFEVTMDVRGVEGDPGEHFVSREYEIYVGCEPPLNGTPGAFSVIVPDAVDDPVALDGRDFTMRFTMLPGTAQEVVFESEGTFVAEEEDFWEFCYGIFVGTSSGGTDSGGTDSGGTDSGGTDSGGTESSGTGAGTSGTTGAGGTG